MRISPYHFLPVTSPFFIAFGAVVVIVIALVEIEVLSYAYERIGIERRYIFAILIGSLLGSYVNLPVVQLAPERIISNQQVVFFGMRYVVPVVQNWPATVIAVNMGGAMIPAGLSLYLIAANHLAARAAIGVAVVAAFVHLMATPVPGIGIAVPTFLPPLLAAVVALLLSRRSAPALAYVSGSLGTLVGADLLNLGRIQGLGAPVASIGGAGTFDGIFLTGVLAVVLAGIVPERVAPGPEGGRATT